MQAQLDAMSFPRFMLILLALTALSALLSPIPPPISLDRQSDNVTLILSDIVPHFPPFDSV